MPTHLYRALLRLYPLRFRRRFGGELTAAFRTEWDDARRRGAIASVHYLAASALDLVVNAWQERRLERRRAQFPQVPDPTRDSMLTILRHDLRFARRTMRRQPAFTAMVVLTLALGIGSTTAIFSILDGVLLRPLPYREPERLAFSWTTLAWIGVPRAWMNGSHIALLQDEARHLEAAVPLRVSATQLTGGGAPEQVLVGRAGTSLFDVLGVAPLLGRTFHADEGFEGHDRVTVLGHAAWLRYFGGDPAILGRTITIGGDSVQVIGVMPPTFRFHVHSSLANPTEPDLWMPGVWRLREMTQGYGLAMLVRTKPGVSIAQAQAEIDTIGARLDREQFNNRGFGWQLVGVQQDLVKQARPALIALIGAATMVLLIACANVASLLLVRSAAREREFALRGALGAGRGRLVAQVLVESVLLAGMGGALGVAIAYASVRAFVASEAIGVPRLYDVAVDARVLLFAAAVGLGTGIAFGLVPALRSTRPDLNETLKDGARGNSSAHRPRGRAALVVCEVALAVVLLLGATLLLRTFAALRHVDPGFDPRGVITARVTLPGARYPQAKGAPEFVRSIVDDLSALPGVEAAAATNAAPLSRSTNQNSIEPEGAVNGEAVFSDVIQVTPGYFASLHAPLRAGRDFAWTDAADQSPVLIVDESFAAAAWPNQPALGKYVKVSATRRAMVVGVVRQPRLYDVHRNDRPQVFVPMAQNPTLGVTLMVRAAHAESLAAALRQAIWARDAGQPVAQVRLLTEVVGRSLADRRVSLLLLTGFAVVALALAALGIYGVMAYAVGQRTHEIGLRMALGARARDVLSMVVGGGLRLIGLGLVLGLIGAVFFTRLLSTQLYGVTATDPLTFVSVTITLLVVALIAAYLPARRAARIDPAIALRAE